MLEVRSVTRDMCILHLPLSPSRRRQPERLAYNGVAGRHVNLITEGASSRLGRVHLLPPVVTRRRSEVVV